MLERVFPLRDAAGEVVGLASHADGPAARQLDAMDPAARLRFAGEHTAVSQPGMEGAAESADRAVAEILARIA